MLGGPAFTVTQLKGLGAADDDDWSDDDWDALLDEADEWDTPATKTKIKAKLDPNKDDGGWSLDDVINTVTKVVDGGVKIWNSTKGIWQDPPPKYAALANAKHKKSSGMSNNQMLMIGGAALIAIYLITQKK
jgi:hypothetical protein